MYNISDFLVFKRIEVSHRASKDLVSLSCESCIEKEKQRLAYNYCWTLREERLCQEGFSAASLL